MPGSRQEGESVRPWCFRLSALFPGNGLAATQAFFLDKFPPFLASNFSHDLPIQRVNKVRKPLLLLLLMLFRGCVGSPWLPDQRFPCTRVGTGCMWITVSPSSELRELWPGVCSMSLLANSDIQAQHCEYHLGSSSYFLATNLSSLTHHCLGFPPAYSFLFVGKSEQGCSSVN